MAISVFGIWDNEIKKFIADLSEQFEEKKLTQWFYNEGIYLFQKAQNDLYEQEVKLHQEQHGKRPVISFEAIRQQKFIGFITLQDAFIKKFVPKEYEQVFSWQFILFIGNAISAHMPFYLIQAEVATNLNLMLDANPDCSVAESFQYVRAEFEQYKSKKPELALEIDNHLRFTSQYDEFIKMKLIRAKKHATLFQSVLQVTEVESIQTLQKSF